MRNGRRWIRAAGWAFASLVGLCLVAWGALYLHTERLLRGTTMPQQAAALPHGDAARGKRLGRILGCSGCHGEALAGNVFMDIPHVARLVAPNLTKARAQYDQAAFVRLMRAGTKADGRLAVAMPNKAHQRLTDQELADLRAYLLSVPETHNPLPATQIRPLARVGIVTGDYDIHDLRGDAPESADVLADRLRSHPGKRLLQVACSECHGIDLAGDPKNAVPPLAVLKGYTPEQFLRLMHEGKTAAGVDSATGFMSRVARYRFTALTEDDVRAMKAFIDES